jgi:hypothetical protein
MRDYDSTVARVAGNILSGLAHNAFDCDSKTEARIVRWCVAAARAIVAETKRTEPPAVAASDPHAASTGKMTTRE